MFKWLQNVWNGCKRVVVATIVGVGTVLTAHADEVSDIEDAITAKITAVAASCLVLAVAGLAIWAVIFAVRRGKAATAAGAGR